MFNVKRIDNVDQYTQWKKTHRIEFRANESTGIINGEIELNTVGPCVARLAVAADEDGPAQVYLLGCVEGLETLRFAVMANRAAVVLEPSAEVWFRKQDTFVVGDNPNPDETFTRMEHMGLEMDELGIALHRQNVLNQIQTGRENRERDNYSRQLERRLDDMAHIIKTLQAPQEPATERSETTETTE